MRRLAVASAVVAGSLLLSACADDAGDDEAGAPVRFGLDDLESDAVVTEVEIDEPEEFATATAVADFDGKLFVVIGGSEIVRCGEGDQCEELEVSGLGEEGVTGLAADSDGLLAINGEEAWRSRDGEQWEAIDPGGLDESATGVIAVDGGFLAFGEDGDDPKLWRSEDGNEWKEQETEGLVDEERYQAHGLHSLAAVGDELLASQYAELRDSMDDSTFALFRSEDGGAEWDVIGDQYDIDGLDDLGQPNTDPLPVVLGVDDGFLAVAGAGDDGEATIFRSEDGREWGNAIALGGPELDHPGDIDAATVTEDGVAVVVLVDGELTVWRVEADR